MFAYLKGPVTVLEPTHCVIECAGVGYWVGISLTTYDALKRLRDEKGEAHPQKVHTFYQVTESAHRLFGFADRRELRYFEQLLAISGVGGSIALAILSSLPTEELEAAIRTEDVNRIKQVKGVGPKTAARIVLELKGKLPQLEDGATDTGTPIGQMREEALQALAALGLPRATMEKRVAEILKSTPPPASVQDVIKLALKN